MNKTDITNLFRICVNGCDDAILITLWITEFWTSSIIKNSERTQGFGDRSSL
jgi:hypothetical protein